MKSRLLILMVAAAALLPGSDSFGSDSASGSADLYTLLHTRLHSGSAPADSLSPAFLSRARREPVRWPRIYEPTLDLARQAMRVNEVQTPAEGSDVIPFTGKGVTIAVIDCGIDPRHQALAQPNAEGQSRIKSYIVTTGAPESPSGQTEAKTFTDPAQITDSDIDKAGEGHGTHTSAIAGGADCGNPYVGIAPEADLFLVSMGAALYDDEIQYGITSALDYAAESAKPIVMNFSLGDPLGSHLGDNPTTNLFADAPRQGCIPVFAAGNDGMNPLSLQKDFSADSSDLASGFARRTFGTAAPAAYMEVYSADDREFEIALTVVAHGEYKEVWCSEFIPESAWSDDGTFYVLNSDENLCALPGLSDYLSGDLILARGHDSSGAFMMALLGQFPTIEISSPYTLGFRIRSKQGASVMAYTSNQYGVFRRFGVPGYTQGNPSQSISDLCTSEYVVSVGAWNARKEWTNWHGTVRYLSEDYYGPFEGVATYSSYGSPRYDLQQTLPHLLAPGTEVISAIPQNIAEEVVFKQRWEKKVQNWANMTGTSMAAPAAAGVIALWLQACPTLTRDQVLQTIYATSLRDSFVQDAVNGSASGKIDAYAGLKYVLENFADPSAVSPPEITRLMVRYLGAGQAECVVPFGCDGGTLEVYTLQGSLLQRTPFTGGSFRLQLPRGAYIVKAVTPRATATQKLLIP